ncbi:hypothetical protein [Clostridium cuniculi]|uniref:hypothetical protein n=1 Tax=Clostridium cuniculi TaxID=2548455 RepID=UPI00140FE495|nr:hypothetical protein [Clostridium cuniculi]
MKNKRWKRKAKRLKGKADIWYECEFCKLSPSTCLSACCVGIRTLELQFKQSK